MMFFLILSFASLANAQVNCVDGNDCYQVGMSFYHNKDAFKGYDKKAEHYFIKACQFNHGKACDYAGWGTRKDSSLKSANQKQVGFYLKGCELQNANSCYNYACYLSLRGKKIEAEKYLIKAAELGYDNVEGINTDQDLTRIDKTKALEVIRNKKSQIRNDRK